MSDSDVSTIPAWTKVRDIAVEMARRAAE